MTDEQTDPATSARNDLATAAATETMHTTHSAAAATIACVRCHLRIGWWSLLFFLALGVVLELFHGFKIRWYLDTANETRRLMFTLAHAHGTLLSLVHIVFAATVNLIPDWNPASRRLASRTLIVSALLIPLGFLLGGIQIYSGDPGIGILLLPAGAFLLFVAVFLTARNSTTGLTAADNRNH